MKRAHNFLHMFLLKILLKFMIGKLHHKMKSIIILAGILSTKFMFKNCQKTSALPFLTRFSINSVQSFKSK